MKSLKKNKIKTLTVIFAFLISSLMIGYIPNINNNELTESIDDNNQIENNIEEDIKERDENIKTSGIAPWWNGTFRYRVEVNLTEPGYFNRVNEPVDVDITFDGGKCHKDTIRVVEYIEGEKNDEIHSQIWDVNLYSDPDFIQTCTITFLATVSIGQRKPYYIYYSDDNTGIFNPKQRYNAESTLTSSLDPVNDQLSISTNKLSLEMEKGRGVYNFTKDGRNYHTDNSLAPWIANGVLDNDPYAHPDPDEGGAIAKWLVLGTFDYFNPNWDNPITASKYHFDVTNQYVEDDYATGGDAEGFLDESKQWEAKDFEDQYDYTSLNGFIDLNYYFGGGHWGYPDYLCGYASTYIRSPVDLNEVYLKVGSDDGIKIWRDGELIHENHVLRSPRPDREYIPLTFEAGRWYNFIVLVEENTGEMGFHFRFSNNSNLTYGTSPQNDPDKITNLDIAMRPPLPIIESISEVSEEEIGPVFSRYSVDWENSGDMHTTDIITVYNNYSLWKSERTFWWEDDHDDMPFSVFNTFYNNTEAGFFNNYFYDNTWTINGINDPPDDFTVKNYTVVNGTTINRVSLGMFISDINEGGSLSLETIDWSIDYDATTKLINIRPADNTSLDNDAGGSSNYLIITFWEYLNDTNFANNNAANNAFVAIYNSLIHPLIQSKDIEESTFFDLTVETRDTDDNLVEGVKVYIYNTTNIKEQEDDLELNQTTNSLGRTTFLRLSNGTYIMNFTYTDDYWGEFYVKTNVPVIVDAEKTIIVNHLNLTRLNLYLFRRGDYNDPISGADVEFWYKNSTGDRIGPIKSLKSDQYGKVLFIWRNVSQDIANISVNVKALGIPRLVNLSSSLNYTFESETPDDIEVNIEDYETNLDRLKPTVVPIEDKFKGDLIDLSYWYYWTNQSDIQKGNHSIIEASVTYTIRDASTLEIKGTGAYSFDTENPPGYYNTSIDTNSIELDLISDRSYQIEVKAESPGYEIKQEFITFTLKSIRTNLTAEGGISSIKVPWMHNITLQVYYNDTLHGDIGLNESDVSYSVPGNPSVSGNLVENETDGWYYLNINSTEFVQIGTYTLSIIAYKLNYQLKEIFITIDITVIHSSLTPSVASITKVWTENFTLTLTFTDEDNAKSITDGTVTYLALGTYPPVEGEFKNLEDGTYRLILNTTAFPYAASYFLRVTATRSNYATQSLDISINILPIPTTINGEDALVEEVEVTYGTRKLLSFDYEVDGGPGVTDATTTYKWNYDGGSFKPGELRTGSKAGKYVLYFDTEDRETGDYAIVISFGKVNYESLSATIFLEIIEREFDADLSAKNPEGEKIKIEDDLIEVVKGDTIIFQLELIDKTDDEPLTDANVILKIGEKEFEFEEVDDGIYEYEFSTEKYEAFFTSETVTAEITIEKDNYESDTIDITIVIGMEEVLPGIPTFYFIMIMGAIVGVVGSLATYRYIQIARIPKFVKKVKKIRKAIKSKDNISESLLYPSKDDYMVKYIGDRWNVLGLSLKDNIGTKDKITKQGGDIK